MARNEIKTKNGGAALYMSYAEFEDGLALTKAVNRVMLDLKLFGGNALETTFRLFGDPEVYALFLRCAEKATYNGRKVNADLFANNAAGDAAAKDILEVFDAVVHHNTSRFFPDASSASSTPPPAA